MPMGAAKGSSGDYLSHWTGVRIRVTGGGTLRPTMTSQDQVTSVTLPTITMATTNRFSAFVLCNVIEQRMQLELKTTAINDDFTIHRVILFGKPIWTQIPA